MATTNSGTGTGGNDAKGAGGSASAGGMNAGGAGGAGKTSGAGAKKGSGTSAGRKSATGATAPRSTSGGGTSGARKAGGTSAADTSSPARSGGAKGGGSKAGGAKSGASKAGGSKAGATKAGSTKASGKKSGGTKASGKSSGAKKSTTTRKSGGAGEAAGDKRTDSKLRADLREFVQAHPGGWGHNEWIGLVNLLRERGHDTSDTDSIGMALERERLTLVLERVPGLGQSRVNAIADKYPRIWNVMQAGAEELAAVAQLPKAVAKKVKDALP